MDDCRGIRRGRCKEPCSCRFYDGGEKKVVCVKCSHPPGLHENLGVRLEKEETTEIPMEVDAPGRAGESSAYYRASVSRTKKKCKNPGCSRLAHYDLDLGEFDYCTAPCRDKHLLKDNAAKIKRDLKDLKVLARECCRINPSIPANTKAEGKLKQIQQSLQHNVFVIHKFNARSDYGIIVSKELVITGVELGSSAWDDVRRDKIFLLDKIIFCNSKQCSLDKLRKKLYEDQTLSLTLDRSNREFLMSIKELQAVAGATHYIVLVPEKTSYGFTVDENITVKDTEKNYPADLSGVLKRDVIIGYTLVVPPSKVFLPPRSQKNFSSEMLRHCNAKHTILLALRRSKK